LIGSVIFGLYYITSASDLLFVGYGFIALAGLVNLGVLIAILLKASKKKENRKRLLRTFGLMLLNLSVLFIYC
jgi:hypothetical protein